jgi:ferredoxin--NADP+ reductase
MGQEIAVESSIVGDVAVFSLDRSLTGQDGRVFGDMPSGGSPPEELVRRLRANDPEIGTVHVLSNTVTASRATEWDESSLAAARRVIGGLFRHYRAADVPDEHERLRESSYNATLTWIREANPDLWVVRVTPDEPAEPFEPGQYTHLGLGYWEPRADDAVEDFEPGSGRWNRIARRAYSVSSSMVDDEGVLVPSHPPDVEFYIVRVPPHLDEIPALTPRLFRKTVGDRIHMSPRFTGHYTLEGVEPDDDVVFLATGTGEAPHNKMAAELLRSGHRGRILSVSCVRYRADLGYLSQHTSVEELYPSYRYVPLTTREPENEGNKTYIQDYIVSTRFEEDLGKPLDPNGTHVFVCGNPLMIGLPQWSDDDPTFPEPLGVCQILHERGFTIDHARRRGNVHYEEYWKER